MPSDRSLAVSRRASASSKRPRRIASISAQRLGAEDAAADPAFVHPAEEVVGLVPAAAPDECLSAVAARAVEPHADVSIVERDAVEHHLRGFVEPTRLHQHMREDPVRDIETLGTTKLFGDLERLANQDEPASGSPRSGDDTRAASSAWLSSARAPTARASTIASRLRISLS